MGKTKKYPERKKHAGGVNEREIRRGGAGKGRKMRRSLKDARDIYKR